MANWDAIKINGSFVRSASIAAVSYGFSKRYELDFEGSAIVGFVVDRFFEHVSLNLPDASTPNLDPNSPKAIQSRLDLSEAARPRSREEIAYRALGKYAY